MRRVIPISSTLSTTMHPKWPTCGSNSPSSIRESRAFCLYRSRLRSEMFDSELDDDGSSVNVRRRAFLGISFSAIAGAALWSLHKPRLIEAAMAKGDPGEVTIVQFSDSGRRLQKVRVPKVAKSDDDWRRQLSPGEFDIARQADTEIAFSGKYWNLHDQGLYRCVCCDNAL